MKKLILFAAIAVSSLAARADYKDYFYMTYEGQEIANGATIVCNTYEADEMWSEAAGAVVSLMSFNCDIATVVTAEDAAYTTAAMFYTDPDKATYQATYPGSFPQFCSNVNCYGPDEFLDNNCGYSNGLKLKKADPLSWMLHLNFCPENFTEATFKVVFHACDRDDDPKGEFTDPDTPKSPHYNLYPFPDAEYSFFVKFAKSGAGVEGVDAGSAAPVYYNMQGVQVARPEKGLYLVKRGAKVTKELIR